MIFWGAEKIFSKCRPLPKRGQKKSSELSEFVKIFFTCVESDRCEAAAAAKSSAAAAAPLLRRKSFFGSQKTSWKFFWGQDSIFLLLSSTSCRFFFVPNSRPENWTLLEDFKKTFFKLESVIIDEESAAAMLWNWKSTEECEKIFAGQAEISCYRIICGN